MKVIVSESKLGIEYLADVISSCNQNGIECIVDDNAGEILYYLPKEGRYGDDKLLQNSDKSIFDLVKDKEQLVKVLRDAKGEEFKKFAVKWNGLQTKGEDEEVYKTDHCNPIRGNFSEGSKMDSAVVYWKDKSHKPMDIDQVHSLNEVLDVLDGMMNSEPEGDLPEIDHIRIGNKDYDQDAIEKYRADMDDVAYDESEDNMVDWCGHPMTKEQAELCDRFWGGAEDLATEFDSAWEDEFGKSAWYWTSGDDHMSQQLSDDLETRPDEFETNGYTDEYEGWGQDIVADAVCAHGLTTWEEVHDYIDASLKHTLVEKSKKVDEDIDNPRDWSASEGEVEIMWDTDEYEDFGIFKGDGSTYLIDYDRVDDHDDLVDEVCKMIGKEYPDLDFYPDDFEIVNEDEFWEQRGGNSAMKKIIKITSYGNYPQYVHAAYNKDGKVTGYFLLGRIRTAAPIDPKDVKHVMAIAKAQALDRNMKDVHAMAIDYKPKK